MFFIFTFDINFVKLVNRVVGTPVMRPVKGLISLSFSLPLDVVFIRPRAGFKFEPLPALDWDHRVLVEPDFRLHTP
jgi:hypothetical protein